jgi:hypothetical protein
MYSHILLNKKQIDNLYTKILINYKLEIPKIYLEKYDYRYYIVFSYTYEFYYIGNLEHLFPKIIFNLLASKDLVKIQLALNLI